MNYGFSDELRVTFVVDRIYWGSAAFLRRADEPWFTEAEVRTLATVGALDRGGSAPCPTGPADLVERRTTGRPRSGHRDLR